MLIKYVFGPKTGQSEHVNPTQAATLITGGFAEAVNPDDLKPDGFVRPYGEAPYRLPKYGDAVIPQPSFSLDWIELKHLQGRRKVLCIKMELGSQQSRWFGYPQDAAAAARVFGRAVPEEILKEYEKRWKKNEDVRAPEEFLNPPKAEKQRGYSHVFKEGIGFVLVE